MIPSFKTIPFVVAATTMNLFASTPSDSTNSVSYVLQYVLPAEHDCKVHMKRAVERFGWTRDDCSEILLEAFRILRNSQEPTDSHNGENAIGLLGHFGSEKALPDLEILMRNETGWLQELAAASYVFVVDARPERIGPVLAAMDVDAREPDSLARRMTARFGRHLQYAAPQETFRENLLRVFLQQACSGTPLWEETDAILLREVPRWRASPQRAANAERMLREHPDDPALTNFFSRVLADVRAQPAFVAGTNRLSDVALPGPKKATATAPGEAGGEDPWADLLADLPEKKPWEPPGGAPRPAH